MSWYVSCDTTVRVRVCLCVQSEFEPKILNIINSKGWYLMAQKRTINQTNSAQMFTGQQVTVTDFHCPLLKHKDSKVKSPCNHHSEENRLCLQHSLTVIRLVLLGCSVPTPWTDWLLLTNGVAVASRTSGRSCIVILPACCFLISWLVSRGDWPTVVVIPIGRRVGSGIETGLSSICYCGKISHDWAFPVERTHKL